MSESQSRRYALLNDQPIVRADDDYLASSEAARSLADLIVASRHSSPLTLAIDAGWGMGKSSLMLQLQENLRKVPDVATLWFNAWSAEGTDALEDLIKSVLASLDENVLRRSVRRLSRARHLLPILHILTSAAAGYFNLSRLVDQLWDKLAVSSQSRSKIRSEIAAMLSDWTARTSRTPDGRLLVVFIDDLDRCSCDVILRICEAIKLYLDVPGIVFIIACDQSVLVQATRDSLGLSQVTATLDYLEKIIQVTYRKPAPDDVQLETLLLRYAEMSGTTELIKDSVKRIVSVRTGRNPRRIKRLINSLVLEYHLDPGWADFGADTLGSVILLQQFYPEFYREFARPDSRDVAREFIEYGALRERLIFGRTLTDADLVFFDTHKVRPPGLDDDVSEALARLDQEIPVTFPALVRDADFVSLLTSLVNLGEGFTKLRRRLQNMPLVILDDHLEASRTADVSLDPRTYQGLRILWIDDHPEIVAGDIEDLGQSGAEVRLVADLQAARDMLQRYRPDVLVSDIARHGNEDAGFDDLQVLTEEDLYGGTVIFFTGRMTPARRNRARSLGASIVATGRELKEELREIAQASASFGRPAAILSRQERTILQLLLSGDSIAAVARKLAISEHTVGGQLDRAREKWEMSGPLDEVEERIMRRAAEQGIIGEIRADMD